MKENGSKKQLIKYLAVAILGFSVSFGTGNCQAYFKGAPAYDSNYRPIYAHMRVERYVDLSSMNIIQNDDTWLVFSVLTASTDEDSDILRKSDTATRYKINKLTREAWIANNSGWDYLNLQRAPYGYEESSFNAVNICYAHLYGEFLNDSSGSASAYISYYKGAVGGAEPINSGDLTVLGIPYNARKSDIISSLGKPAREGVLKHSMDAEYFIAYGGVTFNLSTQADSGGIVSIEINNRDAVTARKIGVGDTESKIINAYGNSYQIVNNNGIKEYRYLWGKARTDSVHGISFHCTNGILSKIIVWP